MMVADARRMLNSDGLGVQVKVGRVPSTPSAVVVGQVPAGGPRVHLGTAVILTVSIALSAPTPAGVPSGFIPEWVSAISMKQWWVLGDLPCSGAGCTNSATIIETKNAGRSFVDLAVPGLVASRLAFINPMHGYAYGSALYSTDDGGVSWTRLSIGGPVTSLAIGQHYVFAVVQPFCDAKKLPCPLSQARVFRASLDSDRWTPVAAGVVSVGNTVAAFGNAVIINLGTTGAGSDDVSISQDDGANFARYPGPGLYCDLSFGSASVVYAYCRSGMFYFLHRSDDEGRRFASSGDRNGLNGCPEGAVVAVSSAVLVGVCGGTGQAEPVLRSNDDGASFQPVLANNAFLVGNGGPEIFAAAGSHLWWSRDGGATWWAVL
jgi:hypothetical protein